MSSNANLTLALRPEPNFIALILLSLGYPRIQMALLLSPVRTIFICFAKLLTLIVASGINSFNHLNSCRDGATSRRVDISNLFRI